MEDYSPDLVYIKGEKNVAADALSRLLLTEITEEEKKKPPKEKLCLSQEELHKEVKCRVTFKNLKGWQNRIKNLKEWVKDKK